MKLSMMSYTLARQVKNGAQFDIAAMCRLAQELKITAVDMVTLYGHKAADVRKILSDHGLAIACHTFMGGGLNKNTVGERSTGVDDVKRGIDDAVTLGCRTVMAVTPGDKACPRDISRRNYIRGLQESIALARAAGITMTIENFPGAYTPFAISSDVLEAIREVPGLKLTFDNGNVLIGGENPAVSFKRCAEHIVHAHFKDWTVMPEGSGTECMSGQWVKAALIGEGIVDQAACLKTMRDCGYKGYVNIEYEGDAYPADQAVRKAAANLRRIMPEL